jgi:DNA modification methylase
MWPGKEWLDESLLPNYEFQQLLIWHYPNNKSPQSRMGFKQTWEPVFLYRKIGSEKQIGVGGEEWGGGLNDFDCHVAAVPQSNFNDADNKQHPAQKPLSVMRWLVNAVTLPGEMVCDPFMGSGTTGIASVGMGRSFHGIEDNADYLELAKGRIAAYAK